MKAGLSSFAERLILALIFFSVLFFGSVHPWSLWSGISAIFFILFLIPESLQRVSDLSKPVQICFSFVAIILIMQILGLSEIPEVSFESSLHWLAYTFLFLMVFSLPSENSRRILIFIALLGFLEAFYGFYEVLSHKEKVLWRMKDIYQGYVTGTFLNRNHFAGFVEMALGLQIGFLSLAISKKKWGLSLAWSVVILICLYSLVRSGSRAGMLCLLLSLLVYIPLLLTNWKSRVMVLALGLLLLGGMVLSSGQHVLARLLDTELWATSSLGRWDVWKGTAKMALHYPLWGSGLGTFEWVFPAFQSSASRMAFRHAHQDYLEILATLGIPGGLALFMGFFLLFKETLKSLSRSKAPLFYESWGIIVGLSSFILHGFFDFNFSVPANHMIFLILGAALLHYQKKAERQYGDFLPE